MCLLTYLFGKFFVQSWHLFLEKAQWLRYSQLITFQLSITPRCSDATHTKTHTATYTHAPHTHTHMNTQCTLILIADASSWMNACIKRVVYPGILLVVLKPCLIRAFSTESYITLADSCWVGLSSGVSPFCYLTHLPQGSELPERASRVGREPHRWGDNHWNDPRHYRLCRRHLCRRKLSLPFVS